MVASQCFSCGRRMATCRACLPENDAASAKESWFRIEPTQRYGSMASLEGFEPPTRRLEGGVVVARRRRIGFESNYRCEKPPFFGKEAARFAHTSAGATAL
jgi:hypothetical protein